MEKQKADREQPTEPAKKKVKTTKPASSPPVPKVEASSGGEKTYSPKEYSALRVEFIQKLKDSGLSHSEASAKFNESSLKRELLSTLPLSELKRRRFCPKDATEHPFA